MRVPLPSLLAMLLAFTAAGGAPWDALSQRSVSRSHQFVIYASDPNARATVAMAVEDTKEKFLKLLDARDKWKQPVVIQIQTPDPADPGQPVSDVRLVTTEEGFKVNLSVILGPDPREAHFPQQLVRSLLLEFAYRGQSALVQSGAPYTEPPAWLVEGMASLAADPDPDAGSGLFKSLIEGGRTPALSRFLSEDPAALDSPSRQLYDACAMSLVRLLVNLPNGHALMQNFIRHFPSPNSDPAAELLRGFPGLNSGGQSLEKWWTLGLASLSASDRYQGLSISETTRQLDEALNVDIVVDKSGATRSFPLAQYSQYRKLPGATAALDTLSVRLLGLEAQSHPLMREVAAAYQDLVVKLVHHHVRNLGARLDALAEYRRKLSGRTDAIADYLNWYEATQRTQASGSFDEYIRTANQLFDTTPIPRTDPISRYMDSVEAEIGQ